jgi:hypothetical protein
MPVKRDVAIRSRRGVLGLVLGGLDYRWDLVTRVARRLARWGRVKIADSHLAVRREFTGTGLQVWLLITVLAALSQLPADLVVSGTATLGDWELQLFWPWSDRGYVFPLVRWGDAVISVVFATGMFAMVGWPAQIQRIAACTLAGVLAYIAVRGLIGY